MSQSHSYMSGRDLLKPEIMLIVLVFSLPTWLRCGLNYTAGRSMGLYWYIPIFLWEKHYPAKQFNFQENLREK